MWCICRQNAHARVRCWFEHAHFSMFLFAADNESHVITLYANDLIYFASSTCFRNAAIHYVENGEEEKKITNRGLSGMKN